MKKKYVILTPTILDMGGAQMYVRNKCIAMQERGWIVDVITAQKGKVYIQDLRKYDYVVPELAFDYFLFSKRKRDKIVNKLVDKIIDAEYDEIVIESTCVSECTWAEVVAERCGASNLCFILQEHNYIDSKAEQHFLTFKQSRNEVVGITPKSMFVMFKTFSPISETDSKSLPAYCNNVVEDTDYKKIISVDGSKYDYSIGLLSRIDKPFIVHAVKDIIRYAEKHSDKHFLFVMMGGAPLGSNYEKNIRELLKTVKNVDLHITGYIFPVPIKLLTLCDALIATAGSAWVCCRSGVPTISYDGNDFRPIGILDRTTKHSLFRDESEKPEDLTSLLDEILLRKKYGKIVPYYDMAVMDFSSHIDVLANMSKEKKYFSFSNIPLSASELQLSFALNLIGPNNYTKLSQLKNRIFN